MLITQFFLLLRPLNSHMECGACAEFLPDPLVGGNCTQLHMGSQP